MTEFTSERLTELKAVAEAATPGRWQWMDGGVSHSTSFGWQPVTLPGESAQYIAAFDPPTVLALIAALDAKTYEAERLGVMCLEMVEQQRDEAREERDDARAALKAKDSYVGDLEEQIQHIKSLWRATGRAEADAHRRAETAEAAIERVREAATEVTNQGDNNGRTHYEKCWQHHLHCLAAKIIYETGGDDD